MSAETVDRRQSGFAALPGPLRTSAAFSACVIVVGAALYLLAKVAVRVAPLVVALVAALLLSALLSPVMAGFRRLRLPPSLAALASVVTLIGVLALTLALVVNRAVAQLSDVRSAVGEALNGLQDFLVNGPLSISQEQLDRLRQTIVERAQGTAPDPVGSASIALEVLGAMLLAIVLLFFLLKDGDQMWRWFVRQFPRRRRRDIEEAGHRGWETLTGYVRGTMIVAAVDAIGIGLALLLIGVPLVLPLALLTFLGAFIPIVGATLAGAAAVLVALVSNGPVDALLVLAAVLAVQQLEGNILEPLVMGRVLRLHPAVILVAVAAGTLVAGIAGAAVAVPLVAVTHRVISVLSNSRSNREPALASAGPSGGHPAQPAGGQTGAERPGEPGPGPAEPGPGPAGQAQAPARDAPPDA